MRSDLPCTRLSDPDHPSVHAYYDCCPEDPAGARIACFRFDGPVPGVGRVEIRDRSGRLETHFGADCQGNGHVGGFATWADDDAVIWVDGPDGSAGDPRTHLRELGSGEQRELSGRIRQFHAPSGRGLVQEMATTADNPHGLCRAIAVIDRRGETIGRLRLEDALAAHPDPDAVPPLATLNLMNSKWAPDGSRFLVVWTGEVYRRRSGDASHPRHKCLLLADATGGSVRFLGDFTHHPAWSPDGRSVIAFLQQEHGQDLVAFDAETGERRVLLRDLPGVHPSLSPDGRSVVTDVFNAPEHGHAQILRIDLASGQREVLAEFAHADFGHSDGHHPHPVFSRDGRRLYFNAQDGGPCGVFVLEL